MAKRMASSAEANATSSSTRPRRKNLMSLRMGMLVGLRVGGRLGHVSLGLFQRHGSAALVFRQWLKGLAGACAVGDAGPHEINPDRQRRLRAGLLAAQ